MNLYLIWNEIKNKHVVVTVGSNIHHYDSAVEIIDNGQRGDQILVVTFRGEKIFINAKLIGSIRSNEPRSNVSDD